MTKISGTASLIALIALFVKLLEFHASLQSSVLRVGSVYGKIQIAGIPKLLAFAARLGSLSIV